MRKRGFSPEHEEAVARRLAALSAEWDAAKAESSFPAAGPLQSVVRVPSAQDWPWEPHTQVRGAAIRTDDFDTAAPPSVTEPLGEIADLQPPGRHASRRAVPGLLHRAAERRPRLGLTDRIGLQLAHLTWVAVIAAVALGATSWWLVRTKEQAMLTPVAVQSASSPGIVSAPGTGAAPASPTGSPSAAAVAEVAVAEVVVDVTGKVRRPGIVVLAQGSRVIDALEAAGGARRGVDLQPLNLARVLLDGEQIVVGGESGPAMAGAAPTAGTPVGALVNLNVASLTELETLPGVGPVTAAAIVEWRTTHGGFTSVEDLLEVSGIGEVTLEQLAPLVTI